MQHHHVVQVQQVGERLVPLPEAAKGLGAPQQRTTQIPAAATIASRSNKGLIAVAEPSGQYRLLFAAV